MKKTKVGNKIKEEVKSVQCIHCFSHQAVQMDIEEKKIKKLSQLQNTVLDLPFIGPGFIDLQVNGIDGIDFNDISLNPHDLLLATQYLLGKGVTTYYPTLITNSDENIHTLIRTIVEACEVYPLVNDCIGGIHLEGPFLSKIDGARGAHDLKYIKAPDWDWVSQCQEIATGKIKIITFSPEWDDSASFVKKCVKHDILVAIGHSNASPEQIKVAVQAGASLSTHLGNAVPLMLPRHPNLLWEQLAEDQLYASIIADGFHLPDAFLKTVIRTKGDKLFLVSDSTCFSGMPPGIYQTHIGDEVILEKEGRLALKKSPDLLAGATKCLLEDVQYLVKQKLLSLAEAWKMASIQVANFLQLPDMKMDTEHVADVVLFGVNAEGQIVIKQVIKNGYEV